MKTYKELMNEFDFKGALKTGMLRLGDKKYVKDLEKKGWEIKDFDLTGKGYELTIKKGSKEVKYTDKTPSKVLQQASKKV